jgi:catechol 1,2-dioxygenase
MIDEAMIDEPKLDNAQRDRLRAVYARAMEKMKEVVEEFEITQDELHLAGDYLIRLGKSGQSRSLVDMALAVKSMDVTIRRRGGTPANLEGPLYRKGHPVRPDGNLLERPPGPTARLLTLSGVVRDAASGAPIPGARLDFWQTDQDGVYDRQGNHLRGVVVADEAGRYLVRTIVPKDYSEHDHDPIGELLRAMGRPNRRAAHIHLKVFVDGDERLTTQLFIPGSEYIECDYVDSAVTDPLLLDLVPDPSRGDNAWRATFDFAIP